MTGASASAPQESSKTSKIAPHPSVRSLVLALVVALLASVAFLEFGLFRYIVTVDNFPLAAYDAGNQILKYWPDQSGIRYPDRDRRHPVNYSINDDGWNSVHPSYAQTRNARRRIAVIGDSFVEAFQVRPAQSVAARLETLLGPTANEVYSFGISGAALSQYLHVARYVARTFHPDAIVVIVVHNDFIESYRPKPATFSKSFLRLDVGGGGGQAVREVTPLPYGRRPVAQWLLARSATVRFGFYMWRTLLERTAESPRPPGHRTARFEANIDVTELDGEQPHIERAAGYLFDQFAQLERSTHTRVLFAMDCPREALYAGKDPRALDVYRLNRLASAEARRAGLSLIDLTEAFVEDYRRFGKRFDFSNDNHWNAHGHDVVAHELARRLTAEASPSPGLAGPLADPVGSAGLRTVAAPSESAP